MKTAVRFYTPTLIQVSLVLALLALSALVSCTRTNNKIIYITATPLRDENGTIIIPPSMTPDQLTKTPLIPTPNPTRIMPNDSGVYMIQPGDTLGSIATLYGIAIEDILALNTILNPNALEVGQTINIPNSATLFGPNFKLIPDSELVHSTSASNFSVAGTVKFQQGFLKAYSEEIDGEIWSGVEIISSVATTYSINPRLLLALLEYRGGWLSNPYPEEPALSYPMGIIQEGREGLLRQVVDTANALNYGYYGWKYRGNVTVTLADGTHIFYAPDLNPGTVGVQYMLSLTPNALQWQQDVHPDGFFQTYLTLFGDPFALAVEPITPPDLTQPMLTLPFQKNEEWVYTGGPHGAYNSGSAWGAIDLAPPEPPEELEMAQGACYVSPNWVTAAVSGVIARSGEGYVVLDLDGDGDEHTGWNLVYLHVDDHDRIAANTVVKAGDKLGHLSCQGGVSNGTHLHLARRYNGEWIPVECEECAPGVIVPPFVLGEWTIHAFTGQEYQGYMTHPGENGYLQAEQTRDYLYNKLSW